MLDSVRRSAVRFASASVLCGVVMTATAVDTAFAQPKPAPPGGRSGASAPAATGSALTNAQGGSSLALASAASCGGSGPYGSVYCPNWVAPIYAGGSRGYAKIDTMRSTYSWFVCQSIGGPNPPFGVGRNHWWLWTQGDDYGRWGWFPANAIKIGGQEQPIPGVPGC